MSRTNSRTPKLALGREVRGVNAAGDDDAGQPSAGRRVASSLVAFLHTEAAGGVVLVMKTCAALVWANSPWGAAYEDLWRSNLTVGFGQYAVSEDLGHWVNDGLMAVFFFVVGLEIKRELVVAGLTFDSLSLVADAKIGILIASVVAGTLGTLLLVGVRHRQVLTSSR